MPCYDCSTIEGGPELSKTVVPQILDISQATYSPSHRSSKYFNPIQGPAIITLYTGAMMQDIAVEQHSTQNGLALNHPIWRLHSDVPSHHPASKQDDHATCLTSPLPSK